MPTSGALPTSGELLGIITKTLRLRESIGADSTSKSVFRGEQVKPESVQGLVADLVGGLWNADLMSGLGRTKEERQTHNEFVVTAVLGALQAWDNRRSRLHVDLPPKELNEALFPFLRLTALDLGMRIGAFLLMEQVAAPSSQHLPAWTQTDGFGKTLDGLLAKSKSARSRSALAEQCGVSANALSSWCTGQSLPRAENIERLSIELARADTGLNRFQVEFELRVALCLGWLQRELAAVLGDDEQARDLVAGVLWVAERVSQALKALPTPARDQQLDGELILNGVESVLGAVLIPKLISSAPNYMVAMDLLGLRQPWVQRVRWWISIMNPVNESLVKEFELTRFFPRKVPTTSDLAPLVDESGRTPAGASALGHVFVGMGDWDRAVQMFSRACKLEPGEARHHYNRAMGLIRKRPPNREVFEEALSECRIAAGLDVKYAEPRIEIGVILIDLGRFEEAMAALADAKQLAPSSASVEYHWGLALTNLKRYTDAVQHYQAALAIDELYVDALVNLCDAFVHTGNWKEARKAAKRAEFLGDPAARQALEAMKRSK